MSPCLAAAYAPEFAVEIEVFMNVISKWVGILQLEKGSVKTISRAV